MPPGIIPRQTIFGDKRCIIGICCRRLWRSGYELVQAASRKSRVSVCKGYVAKFAYSVKVKMKAD